MLTTFKWMGVAYVCGVLALVAISILKTLNEPPQPPRAQSDPQPQDAPQPEPQPQPEPDMQPWGALFSVEQQAKLVAMQQSGAAHARRRMERATQEAR